MPVYAFLNGKDSMMGGVGSSGRDLKGKAGEAPEVLLSTVGII